MAKEFKIIMDKCQESKLLLLREANIGRQLVFLLLWEESNLMEESVSCSVLETHRVRKIVGICFIFLNNGLIKPCSPGPKAEVCALTSNNL